MNERDSQIAAARQMKDDDGPRVYVTQEINADFRKAEVYGRLVFLSVAPRDDFNSNVDGTHNGIMMNGLDHRLREFDPARDYLVLTGSPYVNAAVSLILGSRRLEWVRVLRWDNRARDYSVVGLPLTRNLPCDTITTQG